MTSSVDIEKRPDGKRPGWRERARLSTERAVGPPDMEGLSNTLKRGALYSAAAMVFGQVISFVQTLVLAHLLTPTDLGLFVAGTLLSGFLISVSEGGLRGALIQRENDVARAADTVFWATAGTGVLLALVAVGTAPIVGMIADFGPELTGTVVAIAAANAGTMILHALTNVPDGLMQRQFNFRRRLIVDPARMLVFAVVSITFAAMGYGAWAQVIGNYAAMFTWVVLSWWFSGWWPGFAKPSYKLWREMAKFAFPLLLEGIVDKIRTSAESALIARGLSADPLGNYRYGQRLSLIPGNAVVQIGSYVLFPAFSRLASEPDRLRNAFIRGLQWAWIASAAVAGLVVAVGEPAVVLLLGEKWRGAGIAFVALAGYGPGIALQAAGSEAIKATGRSQLLNWTTATSIVLGLGLLVALMPPFGLVGVGLAASATELVVGVVILVLTYKVIPYSIPTVVRVIVPPLVMAAIAGALTGYLEHVIINADQMNRFLGILVLVGESLLFLVIFLAGMAAVEPKLARRAVKAIKAKLLRRGGEDEEDEDDGVERPDPLLDPPTMLIPVFTADETMEFGRRQIRDWGSPTAQTMVLPLIRPQLQKQRQQPQQARLAEADVAVDRAEDAIQAGERIPVGSLDALEGPTEAALPARNNGPAGHPHAGPPLPPGRPQRPVPAPPAPGRHGPVRPAGPPPGPPRGGVPGSPPSPPYGTARPPAPVGGSRVPRQAPPNGGRGPRPPTPPRDRPTGRPPVASPGGAAPYPQQPPQQGPPQRPVPPPQGPPGAPRRQMPPPPPRRQGPPPPGPQQAARGPQQQAGQPPRRHRYIDDSGPLPGAPSPVPRRRLDEPRPAQHRAGRQSTDRPTADRQSAGQQSAGQQSAEGGVDSAGPTPETPVPTADRRGQHPEGRP